jgi:hypothetical protein
MLHAEQFGMGACIALKAVLQETFVKQPTCCVGPAIKGFMAKLQDCVPQTPCYNGWVHVVSVLQAAATNAALQALKQAKLTAEQETEAAAKQAELQAAAGDPWFNEDPQQAASSLSPVRVSCS